MLPGGRGLVAGIACVQKAVEERMKEKEELELLVDVPPAEPRMYDRYLRLVLISMRFAKKF